MSVQYLLDIFQNDPFQGFIKEVVIPVPTRPTNINGRYVVRVPDDVVIPDGITNPNDLLTQKYAGMLANSGIFTRIVYDDMSDPYGIDMVNSTGVSTGMRGSCALYPASFVSLPTMQMSMVALGGPAPSQCMLHYELFKCTPVDNAYERYQRTYEEVLPDIDVSCALSFNNGATWTSVFDSTLANIAPVDQGTQLIVQFTRASFGAMNPRLYLGSWAVLY